MVLGKAGDVVVHFYDGLVRPGMEGGNKTLFNGIIRPFTHLELLAR